MEREPEILTKERKTLMLTRVPPGDRWQSATVQSPVFDSLTAGLQFVFEQTGITEFHLSSFDGKVYTVLTEEIEPTPPPPPRRYALYGE